MELTPPILTTERLILRTASEKDAAAIATYASESREFHEPWGPRRPDAWYTAAYWEGRISDDEAKRCADQGMMLLVLERETETLLGRVNFSNVIRGAFHAAHLSYELRESAQGRGLMHEALQAALEYAFGPWNLHRVMANHMPDNVRSQRVLERLGFVREGVAKDYLYIDGRWQDHVLNSIVNEGWKAPD